MFIITESSVSSSSSALWPCLFGFFPLDEGAPRFLFFLSVIYSYFSSRSERQRQRLRIICVSRLSISMFLLRSASMRSLIRLNPLSKPASDDIAPNDTSTRTAMYDTLSGNCPSSRRARRTLPH